MKSVSLSQPSASLLAIGAINKIRSKRYTAYRGPVAIYALPFRSMIEQMRVRDHHYLPVLAEHYDAEDLKIGELPTERIVGVGHLEDCIEAGSDHADQSPYLWQFGKMRLLGIPISYACARGLADLPERIAERLEVFV